MADKFKPAFINNVVTPKGRLSFPHLAKPDEGGRFSDGKFKVTLVMPKEANLSNLKAAVVKVAQDTWGPGIKLKELQHPFRDGNEKADKAEFYADTVYITCKSKNRPVVVGPDRKAIDPAEVYGGCDARLVVTAMSYETYDKQTKRTVKGVTFLLDIVQKIADNDRFGGGASVDVLNDGEIEDGDDAPVVSSTDPDEDDLLSTPPARLRTNAQEQDVNRTEHDDDDDLLFG